MLFHAHVTITLPRLHCFKICRRDGRQSGNAALHKIRISKMIIITYNGKNNSAALVIVIGILEIRAIPHGNQRDAA